VAAGSELVADATHDVDVGEVVELDGMTDAEVLLALLGAETRQVGTGLALAAGG